MIIAAAAAALLGAAARPVPRTDRSPRPAANLNPDKASSGNKARLLERYMRRQRRLGGSDHG